MLRFKSFIFYLAMASKHKSNDGDNSDMPKRGSKMLPLSKKLEVLDIIRKKHSTYKIWYYCQYHAYTGCFGIYYPLTRVVSPSHNL